MREMIERSGGKTAAPQIFVDGRRVSQIDELSQIIEAHQRKSA